MPDKKTIRKQAREKKQYERQAGRTYKKGVKTYAKGEKKLNRAMSKSSKSVSKSRKSGTLSGPKKSTRYKAMDAQKMMGSGSEMMNKARKSGYKPKKTTRAYRTTKAQGYGKNAYVSRSGKVVKRKRQY